MTRTIEEVYCHIENGGVTFSVVDDGEGPTIRIQSAHYGNNKIKHDLHVTTRELALLGSMFSKAAEYGNYSKTFWAAAHAHDEEGFPKDDANSIQQGSGTADLNFWYSHQFVQNEEVKAEISFTENRRYQLGHKHLLEGTLVGSVYANNQCVQTFVVNSEGEAKLTAVGSPTLYIVDLRTNHLDGEIDATWNAIAGETRLVVSYEYDYTKENQ